MSNTKGIRAGRAYVELFAESGPLAAGLRSAAAKLKAWGASIRDTGAKIAAMGGLAMTPMIAAAKGAASAGAELYDMAARTGMSVEQLSRLKYAADLSGVSMEATQGAVGHLAKNLTITGGNAHEVMQKLNMLGLSVNDLKGLSPGELFEKVGGAIEDIQDPTARAAAAMQVFGESGAAILPMLDELAARSAEADKYGFTKTAEQAKNAKELSNVLAILAKSFHSIADAIGEAVIPVIKPFLQNAIEFLLKIRDWAKANTELIQTVFRIAATVFGAGLAITGLGYAVMNLGKVFSIAASIVPMLGTAISAIVAVVGFLVTPLGAVIGLVGALAAYWVYSSGAMGEAADWLGEVFDGLRQDAVAAFGGISDALAAGDFALAAQILWTTLKIWWEKGTGWISSIWNDAMGLLTQRWYETIGGFRIIFEEIGHGLTVAWIGITAGMSEAFNNFIYGIQVAWNWCGKMLQKAWNAIKGVFDKNFDSEAANKAAEQAYQDKVGELKKDKDAKIAALDEQYNNEMATEKRLNQDNLSKIVQETEASKKADQADRDKKLKNNQEELAKLQAERDGLVGKAKTERKQKDLADKLKNKPGDMKSLADLTPGGGFDPNALRKSYSVIGSFSGAAAFGMAGGTSHAERTAKATEATARKLDNLIGIVDQKDGPVFA